jgi:transcriptional regulator with XRE-family HTH domain
VGLIPAHLVSIDGSRLRRARVKLRLSGPELSSLSGVSQATISRAERERVRLTTDNFARLVYALSVEVGVSEADVSDWLRGDSEGLSGSPIITEMAT